MKVRFALATLAAACLSTVAAAQMGPGMDHRGMGPGMMDGPGKGPGMMMDGPGKGPGMMMDGPGKGPGMMGRHDGCGMGPGMMGGHRMGHGRTPDPGMMGGHGPGALERLGLNDEQRGKVREIHRDLQRKHLALMGQVRDLRWQSEDAAKSAEFDEAAARKRFDAGAAIRKQIFEARLGAHKRIQEVLTREQREQLGKSPGRGPMGPGARL